MAYVMAHGDPRVFPSADSNLQLRELAGRVDFAFVRKQEVH